MPSRERIFFPVGVNMYVPGMSYASDFHVGEPTPYSLGTPAAVSANAIAAATAMNAAPGTQVTLTTAFTMDSPYGRTLRLTPSGDPGAVGGTIDVFGTDYLGQPMAERFSGANGSTAIVYGQKAFRRVTHTINRVASTNATTWAIGTGWRMGLPYKGDVAWAKEAGVLVNVWKRDFILWLQRAAAKAVAGGSDFLTSPSPGFIKTLYGVPAGGGGATDPVITVKLATVAVVGLTVTIDTSDTAGLTVSDVPTTPGYSANNRFRTNGLIEVVAGAAAGAFADQVGVEITPTQVTPPVLTDPQTLLIGDPRGTYEPLMTPDGASELVVGLVGDPFVNAAGNGGLYGIKHVIA